MSRKYHAGFTIVELLIVIVVIAILAAITVTAYNGIQTRANDSSVQADISAIARTAKTYNADNGTYPTYSQLATLTVKMNKASYLTTNNAALYCAHGDGSTYAVIAKSKSGKTFYSSSSSGTVEPFTPGFPAGSATNCASAGSSSGSGNWLHDMAGGWKNWIDG